MLVIRFLVFSIVGWSLVTIIITVLINAVGGDEQCKKDNIIKALPAADYVIYGMRTDGAVTIMPKNYVTVQIPNDTVLVNELQKKQLADYTKVDIKMVDAAGDLELFLLVRRRITDYNGMISVLRVVNFMRILAPNVNGSFLYPESTYNTSLEEIATFTDAANRHLFFQVRYGDEFSYVQLEQKNRRYVMKFKRIGKKLLLHQVINAPNDPGFSFENETLKRILFTKETNYHFSWLVRRQDRREIALDCFTYSKRDFALEILYQARKKLLKMFNELNTQPTKVSHLKEVKPFYKEGSVFVLAKNGVLYSYMVTDPEMKFSEILELMDYRQKPWQPGMFNLTEKIYLFSINGIETLVLIVSPDGLWYKLFVTAPVKPGLIKRHKLVREEFKKVKKLKGPIEAADYNGSHLCISHTNGKGYSLQITDRLDDSVKKTPECQQIGQTDHFTGAKIVFKKANFPWQTYFGQRVNKKKSKNEIQLIKEVTASSGETTSEITTITKYGKSIDYLLYFPSSVIDRQKQLKVMKKSEISAMLFGVKNCTAFIVIAYEDIKKLPASTGCTRGRMRAYMEDGYMTIIRESNPRMASVFRFKAGFEIKNFHEQIVMSSIPTHLSGSHFYYLMKDSDFGNGFPIKEYTFNLTYAKGEYVYYIVRQKNCTVTYVRRHISSKKTVKFEFPMQAIVPEDISDAKDCPQSLVWAFYDYFEDVVLFRTNETKNGTYLSASNLLVKKMQQYSGTPPEFIFQDLLVLPSNNGSFVVFNLTEQKTLFSVNTPLESLGLYEGSVHYGCGKKTPLILPKSRDIERGLVEDEPRENYTAKPTKSLRRVGLDKAVDEIEKQFEAAGTDLADICGINNTPYLLALIVKVCVVDVLLTLITIGITLYHRVFIIPRRRRWKIRMRIVKAQKKRKFKERAMRRLREFYLLRHCLMRSSGSSSSSSTDNQEKRGTKQTTFLGSEQLIRGPNEGQETAAADAAKPRDASSPARTDNAPGTSKPSNTEVRASENPA